jgi:hypothetical protein
MVATTPETVKVMKSAGALHVPYKLKWKESLSVQLKMDRSICVRTKSAAENLTEIV